MYPVSMKSLYWHLYDESMIQSSCNNFIENVLSQKYGVQFCKYVC